ncbi:MAG: iron ABC transporter substrate-binding protein, partial [Ramlibacter sp.]
MKPFTLSFAACALAFGITAHAQPQTGVVNALCSTDASWCEAAAADFTRSTGIKVNQAHKGTGEIAAQL